MTTTLDPTYLDVVDVPLDDAPPVDPWVHAEPVTELAPAPEPQLADDGLTPAVRKMVAELRAHYNGADPGSIDKAITTIQPISDSPKSWDSRGQAGAAVKAYRASIGVPAKPTAKKPAARTAPAKPRRTAAVQTKPAAPVPPVVRDEPEPVVQDVVREPVPPPPVAVQPEPVPQPIPEPEPVVQDVVRRPVVWPVMLLAAPAFVAVWSGWVGLGKLTGFGMVDLLPGIVAQGGWATIDSAITLPIGVETYAAYALYIWLSGRVPARARVFAKWSAIASLIVGALGQVAYHLLVAAGVTAAPWWITTLVACLPVAVLGMGAALAHLVREDAR
ncbi:ABC transporter permease [Micromonospora sp. NPDC023633]|uniref:ABC transporter permease n=1 Tax=Micromonospora sp. NPDC023633 TaxID=3154320 RepID=UPI0033D8474B